MSVALLRLVGGFLLIVVGAAVGMYLLTGDQRWLRWTWILLKYTLLVAGAGLVFLAVERIVRAG